jgi:hypothetical protein
MRKKLLLLTLALTATAAVALSSVPAAQACVRVVRCGGVTICCQSITICPVCPI